MTCRVLQVKVTQMLLVAVIEKQQTTVARYCLHQFFFTVFKTKMAYLVVSETLLSPLTMVIKSLDHRGVHPTLSGITLIIES